MNEYKKLSGPAANIIKYFSENAGDYLVLFSLGNSAPCEVFKKCLPSIVEDFDNQFSVVEVPLGGTKEEAHSLMDEMSVKFFPTLRLVQSGTIVADLKGGLQAEDHINYARIYKWLLRFYNDKEE